MPNGAPLSTISGTPTCNAPIYTPDGDVFARCELQPGHTGSPHAGSIEIETAGSPVRGTIRWPMTEA